MSDTDPPDTPDTPSTPGATGTSGSGPRSAPTKKRRGTCPGGSRLGARRAGVAPDPGLGHLGVGHPHGDQHRPVRRHHGAAGAQPGHHRAPGDARRPTSCSRPTSCRTRSRRRCRPRRSRSCPPIVNEVHGLRLRPGAQGLREPEVRPAVGHAEPAQPRRRDRHPHRQADAAAEEARARAAQIVAQRLAGAQQPHRRSEPARRHAVQPAQADPVDRATAWASPSSRKQQVSKFSGCFNLIVKLKWVIPVIALVLADPRRSSIAVEHRKTLLRLAIGVALVTLLLLAGLSLGPHHLPQPGRRAALQPPGGRRRVGHRAALPQDRPALDAAGLGAGRPRRLGGRAGPLRRVDPLDLRQGRPLGGRAGP